MNTQGTDLGKVIKIVRETRGMSRMELSEAANISESHLKKIGAGARNPGIAFINQAEWNADGYRDGIATGNNRIFP